MLIVGRDRAHVRLLLKEYPGCEIISAAAFFDRVRMLAFLADAELKCDDYAPLLFAHHILTETKVFAPHYAPACAKLYNALYHGTKSPSEILSIIGTIHYSFKDALIVAAHIEERMKAHNLVTKVSALYNAWRLCEEKKIRAPGLNHNAILIRYLIDLSSLEVEIIKTLSRLGIHFELSFPLDFAKRNLNVAVDFAARQFEKDESLAHINLSFDSLASDTYIKLLINNLFTGNNYIEYSDDQCELYEALSLAEEAEHLAKRIAERKNQDAKASIAVTIRNYDNRVFSYKRALKAFNINIKDPKGEPLLQSPAALLLATFFEARLENLPPALFISIISNKLFSIHIINNSEKAELCEILRILAVNNLIDYEKALVNYEKVVNNEYSNKFRILVEQIKNILYKLNNHDSFQEFIKSVVYIITNYFDNNHSSTVELLKHILLLEKSAEYNNHILSIRELINLFTISLQSITSAESDEHDPYAVEILLLPELLGRQFDHLFIVDLAFGRIPKSPQRDPLINDEQRIILNKALGFQALRVFVDDPFEPLPVPPRQALEPFWFAAALASSTKSIYLSYAKHDDNGIEQAPSEFFIWLKKHVIISPTKRLKVISLKEARHIQSLSTDFKHPYGLALQERNAAFLKQEGGDFAFHFDASLLLSRFEKRALTPSLIEAFASCAFYGVLSKIINLNAYIQDPDEIDATIIGKIAHQSLEQFFAQKNSPENLRNIINNITYKYINNNYISNIPMLWCYIDWLHDLLIELVEQFEARPFAQEQAFGISSQSLPGLCVRSDEKSFILGGIIDRVDIQGQHIVVTDYKLSTRASLKLMLPAMLKTSFQMPLYLRLAAHKWADNDPQKVSFVFASIRDAMRMPPLSAQSHPELFARIFDDNHPESLSRRIDAIFAPLQQGFAHAQKSAQCDICDFSYICRHKQAFGHG
jgi:hypothetical protein